MKEYTLQDAAIILSIDTTTLHRWIRHAGIEVKTDEGDKRRRVITHANVLQLAKEHHRTLSKSRKNVEQDTTQRIAALEHRVTSLERQLAVLTRKDTDHESKGLSEPLQTQKGDIVGWREFSRLHGISETTIQKAIESNRLQVVKGDWKIGRIRFTTALDRQGQAQFYQMYHTHQNFTPCPNCPHA